MLDLLIATNNPGKVVEIRSLLKDQRLPIRLVTPSQLGLDMEVDENGQTYAENAGFKAQAFSRAFGLLTLADDSGLEVDALGGRPGLHSNRFFPPAGQEPWKKPPPTQDARRRAWLVHNLGDHPRPWTACFHCTVALAVPGGDGGLKFAEGRCPGEIIPEERGSNGFGYDPIFLLPELGLTMAELSMAQKNQLSHRARAIIAAVPLIRAAIQNM